MENSKRGNWGSTFGFLLAAIGSAVGLGNIWGFPYKMGKTGGGVFLLVYLVLVVLVGFAIMLGELTIGRKTNQGSVGAYKKLYKKFSFIGYMGLISGFLILSFYCVLGGVVLKYMVSFFMGMFSATSKVRIVTGEEFFASFATNGPEMLIFFCIFLFISGIIVLRGISKGIENFSKIAMPALIVSLLVIIIYVLCQDGAYKGLQFMFNINFKDFGVDSAGNQNNFFDVIKTAAGQMFFSLSLGMGCMVTYGSYLKKNTNIEKMAIIIPIADTIVALLASLLVMPAVFAFGKEPTGGPSLLFVTLHNVFANGMGGFIGSFMGFLFYFLVFIAAITSSISLFEVCISFVVDRKIEKGKTGNRITSVLLVSLLTFIIGIPVAIDGFGMEGSILNVKLFGFCFLDFYDLISEGILMPIGALLMSILIGWIIKTKVIKEEVEIDGIYKMKGYSFFDICFKYIAPIIMLIVLITQLESFGIISFK